MTKCQRTRKDRVILNIFAFQFSFIFDAGSAPAAAFIRKVDVERTP